MLFRSANIHGYYHAGDSLEEILTQVVADVHRRDIRFPSWESLRVPVRSTLNGQYLDSGSSSPSLLDAMLHNILIGQVDWRKTSEVLVEDLLQQLHQDQRVSYNILPMGPNARPLLRAMDLGPGHSRLQISGPAPSAVEGPLPDDIAIVGMSVNYPSGKGQEELWQTLESGLNTVEEVCGSTEVRTHVEN